MKKSVVTMYSFLVIVALILMTGWLGYTYYTDSTGSHTQFQQQTPELNRRIGDLLRETEDPASSRFQQSMEELLGNRPEVKGLLIYSGDNKLFYSRLESRNNRLMENLQKNEQFLLEKIQDGSYRPPFGISHEESPLLSLKGVPLNVSYLYESFSPVKVYRMLLNALYIISGLFLLTLIMLLVSSVQEKNKGVERNDDFFEPPVPEPSQVSGGENDFGAFDGGDISDNFSAGEDNDFGLPEDMSDLGDLDLLNDVDLSDDDLPSGMEDEGSPLSDDSSPMDLSDDDSFDLGDMDLDMPGELDDFGDMSPDLDAMSLDLGEDSGDLEDLDLSGEADDLDTMDLDLPGETDDLEDMGLDLAGEGDDLDDTGLDLDGDLEDLDLSSEGEDMDAMDLDLPGETEDLENMGLDLDGEADDLDDMGLDLDGDSEDLEDLDLSAEADELDEMDLDDLNLDSLDEGDDPLGEDRDLSGEIGEGDDLESLDFSDEEDDLLEDVSLEDTLPEEKEGETTSLDEGGDLFGDLPDDEEFPDFPDEEDDLLGELSDEEILSDSFMEMEEADDIEDLPDLEDFMADEDLAEELSPGVSSESEEDPKLYSPRSNVCWESFLDDRLPQELDRAASENEDLSFVYLRDLSVQNDEDYKDFSQVLTGDFPYRDMIFEWGDQGFAMILPNSDLVETLEKLDVFINDQPERDIRIGATSRNGRLLDKDQLIGEASAAIKRTSHENKIVGFRADPERYRLTVSNS